MLVVIMGATSVGKDTILNKLKNEHGFEVCISSTTRPMRENEINGKDYHFIPKEEFIHKSTNDELLEYRKYNVANGETWWYGLDKKSVDLSKNQLVILDAQGYETVVNKLGEDNVLGIYIYIDERTKIIRALNREQNRNDREFFQELYRRLGKDLIDFTSVEDNESIDKVENIDLDTAIEEILYIIYTKINNNIDVNKLLEGTIISQSKNIDTSDEFAYNTKVKVLNTNDEHLKQYINQEGFTENTIRYNKGVKKTKVRFSNNHTAYFKNEFLQEVK